LFEKTPQPFGQDFLVSNLAFPNYKHAPAFGYQRGNILAIPLPVSL